jgi:hypothetical protein
MADPETVTIRMFGLLQTLRKERGLPTTVTVEVPAAGVDAETLAGQLDLPIDNIEGVFCNGTVYGLDRVIIPGDRIGFVPYGTPGPHRFYLGLYAAGKRGHRES